jgi:hypothetical protein
LARDIGRLAPAGAGNRERVSTSEPITIEREGDAVVVTVSAPPGSRGIGELEDDALDALEGARLVVIDVSAAAPLGGGTAEAVDALAVQAGRRGTRVALVADPERPLADDPEAASDALAAARIFESREAALSTLDYVE